MLKPVRKISTNVYNVLLICKWKKWCKLWKCRSRNCIYAISVNFNFNYFYMLIFFNFIKNYITWNVSNYYQSKMFDQFLWNPTEKNSRKLHTRLIDYSLSEYLNSNIEMFYVFGKLKFFIGRGISELKKNIIEYFNILILKKLIHDW